MTEPEVNFLSRYATEIIAGLVAIFLAVLKVLGARQPVQTPIEQGVTKVELLEVQMEINKTISIGFDKMRLEMQQELRNLHVRIDKQE
jgi:hypothetical protein